MKLSEIAKYIGIDCSSELEIGSLATLKEATNSCVSFFHDSKYINDLSQTKAAAVILEEKYAFKLPKGSIALISEKPYEAMAKATALFAYKPSVDTYNPTVADGAKVANSVNCAKNVTIGKNSTIMAGVYLGENVQIGQNCIIYPNVTIYNNCIVGNNCIIHSGTVIGSDGFGFSQGIKFYQIGNVIVEDNVEIGSNCTIDRAALGSTIIKEFVKLDNMVHIAHNCIISEHSMLAAQVGISGSTTLGKGVVMGGQSGAAGHLSIGDGAMFAGKSGVTKSLEGGKIYGGFPAIEIKQWRKMQAAIMRLVKRK